MEIPFRKQLHQATQAEHNAVEAIFNFNEGLQHANLEVFYCTMLSARHRCKPLLDELQIDTFNAVLIAALEKDLKHLKSTFIYNEDAPSLTMKYANNFSNQLGIFYVFAGSSAGAKILLNMAQQHALKHPFYYLNALVKSSKAQMTTLKTLLNVSSFNTDDVISSAKNTFKLIQNIGTYELQQRHTKIQNT